MTTDLLGRFNNVSNEPALLLTPWLYSLNTTLSGIVFYSLGNDDINPYGREYLDVFARPPGLGIKCVTDQPFKCWNLPNSTTYERFLYYYDAFSQRFRDSFQCSTRNSQGLHQFQSNISDYTVEQTCGCSDDSRWQCMDKDYRPEPVIQWTNTSDAFVDVTGRNISQWILMTYRQFSSSRCARNMHYELFFIDSYGGFELGLLNVNALDADDSNAVQKGVQKVFELISGVAANLSIPLPIVADHDPFDQNRSFLDVVKRAVVSFDTSDNVKVWFNNKGWASLPVYMNVLSNAALRVGSRRDSRLGIALFNHPLNYSAEQLFNGDVKQDSRLPMFHVILTLLAFSIVPASFVLFLIDERVNQSKHLQFVSGLPPWLYWLGNFIWDMTNFLLPVALVTIVFFVSRTYAYTRTVHELSALLFLLILYGFAVIPLMYLFTFVFRTAPLAFVILSGGSFLIGVITTVVIAILRFTIDSGFSLALNNFEDENLKIAYDITKVAFLFLPQYNLGDGLMSMNLAYVTYETGSNYLKMVDREDLISLMPIVDLYDFDQMGRGLVCLFIQGIVGFLIVLLVEYRLFSLPCRLLEIPLLSNRPHNSSLSSPEDVDVNEERIQVLKLLAGNDDDHGIIVNELSKMYSSDGHLAVDRLTFVVGKGQCFGLLGVNGAGKTTTFDMLTVRTRPSAGVISLHGFRVLEDMHRIYQMIGYCPQFDALHGSLSGREQLALYARIRAIDENDIPTVVDWAIKNMHLTKLGDETTISYSGGNRRKLSTAIALLGNPLVVLLDEPSAGMDPKTRRFMWNLITQLRRENRTVILSSHSMEECEQLCTRIGIMVDGRLQCLGSVQHLKDRFGNGYTLIMRLHSESDVDEACRLVEQELPGAQLVHRLSCTIRYQLSSRGFRLADAFLAMQKIQCRMTVDDYSLSQTTLDQVFVNLAERQTAQVDEDKDEPFTGRSIDFIRGVIARVQYTIQYSAIK